ncbi:hypothetical protein [Nocardia salmonicida]|uniref:hypothetical protein n=1 Tax=Nocardia salmonicida TaxID=53431 RepID=UPI00340B4FA1
MSTTAAIESVVPDTNLFIDAIADIRDTFLTFDRDHRGAVEALPAALALATEHDWKLLDYMVEVFTLFPLDAALSRLTFRFKTADDLERHRMLELVPDTDPGLHSHETADLAGILEARARRNNSTVADEFAKLHANSRPPRCHASRSDCGATRPRAWSYQQPDALMPPASPRSKCAHASSPAGSDARLKSNPCR